MRTVPAEIEAIQKPLGEVDEARMKYPLPRQVRCMHAKRFNRRLTNGGGARLPTEAQQIALRFYNIGGEVMKNAPQRLLLILVAAATVLAGGPAGAQQVLDRVVITGTRWSFAEQRAFEEAALLMEIGSMWDLNDFSQLTPTEVVTFVALTPCGSNPRITNETKNVTSHGIQELRAVAATNIIDTALGTRSYSLNNKTVSVMYSDGGTESFKYLTYVTIHLPIASTLKKGDGVPMSACRAGA